MRMLAFEAWATMSEKSFDPPPLSGWVEVGGVVPPASPPLLSSLLQPLTNAAIRPRPTTVAVILRMRCPPRRCRGGYRRTSSRSGQARAVGTTETATAREHAPRWEKERVMGIVEDLLANPGLYV